MFNHYMGIGGTSWDDLACDEVYTSYEFTAGIDEYGSIKENFRKAKEINYFLNSFDLTNTENRTNLEFGENMYAVTREDKTNNCEWLFIRNMNTETKDISFASYNVNIKPFDMKICPVNLKLKGCEIEFSDVEIFAKLENGDPECVEIWNRFKDLSLKEFNKIYDLFELQMCIGLTKLNFETPLYLTISGFAKYILSLPSIKP